MTTDLAFSIAFYMGDAFYEAFAQSQSSLTLYLALRILKHKLSLLDAIIHASLANSTLLMFLAFLKPRLPTLLGQHRLSQAFQAIYLPSL